MKAVVVGAGPAGAATALLLARGGLEVTLLERERSFERVFRGEGLMPSGADALLQMGLGELLESIPSRRVDSWNIWMDGAEVFVIPEPTEALGDRAVRVVSQPALLRALIEEAARSTAFRFEPGARAHGLLRDGPRGAGVRVAQGGEVRDLRADLVIACDGRGSPVRHMAGLELRLLPEQYDVLWCKLPAPAALQGRCPIFIMVAAGRNPAICYPSWDGRLQYGLVVRKGAAGPARGGDWVEELVQSAPTWLAQHVRAHRAEIDGPQRLTVLVGRAPAWTAPGLLLLGDAAHPMSPVRAQGVNLALRDAIVAANHLVPALRSGDPVVVDAAARAVQAEREPEIVRSQALQRVEAAGEVEARNATWRYRLARRLAPKLGRYRWAQQLWVRRQRELRHGVTEVRLRPPAEPRPESRTEGEHGG